MLFLIINTAEGNPGSHCSAGHEYLILGYCMEHHSFRATASKTVPMVSPGLSSLSVVETGDCSIKAKILKTCEKFC